MRKYLHILNWVMAFTAFLVWLCLAPVFGFAIFVGAIIGGMLSTGAISWQYHKDRNTDKSEVWQSVYFDKDYLMEVVFHLCLMVVFLIFSFWSRFVIFPFLGGMALMWFCNIVVESAWFLIVIKRQK